MPNLITIPKPCNEDWNSFTEAEQGKHCQVCAKTVIDFTEWQPIAISNYLSDKAEGETCGRFTKAQLEEPIPTAEEFTKQISYFRISTLKKIAAIFLFAFVIENNSYASNEIVHGGTLINHKIEILEVKDGKVQFKKLVVDSVDINRISKLKTFDILKPQKNKIKDVVINDKKPKKKKKTKYTKGRVICVKQNTPNNEIIMGKMIAMPVDQHLMGDTVIIKR